MTIPYATVEAAPSAEHAQHQYVRMRDGVKLSTDVYTPSGEQRPTVLTRTPYDIGSDFGYLPHVARYFNERGYHFVAQDVRGKFRSEGETVIFINEANDGHDTIEWITQQSWSNGEVVMWGDSYYGFTQWAAVSTKHPALKAISPRITGIGLGQHPDESRDGNFRDIYQAVLIQYTTSYFLDHRGYDWENSFSQRPYIREFQDFQAQLETPSPSFGLYYPHHMPIRRFPEGHPFDAPAIPTLITTGWWDNCALWVWRDYWNLMQRADWRSMLHLVIDPVDHNYNYFGEKPTWGDERVNVLDEFLPRYLDASIEFFDHYLGKQHEAGELPRARWNLVGADGYKESESWPPKHSTPIKFFPATEGLLASEPTEPAVVEWTHDPENPVPAPVIDTFNFLGEQPNETELSKRSDVQVFTTKAFTDQTDLVGRVFFTCRVSTTGPRMDVIARLYDVAPDGKLTRISGGQRHIIDASQEVAMTFEMDPVGYRLKPGHALRLHVSSSEFPTYIHQPGTTENEWDAVVTEPTQQRLHLGEAMTVLEIGVLQ